MYRSLTILGLFLLFNTSYAQEESLVQTTEFSFILKPSPLGGIGVFAAHDIAAGTRALSGKFEPRTMKTKEIPEEFLKYCIHINDEECLCPQLFDRMEIGWYLNHSDTPNIVRVAHNQVYALRDIKAGEEILIDYNQFDEPVHLKEAYYWTPNP